MVRVSLGIAGILAATALWQSPAGAQVGPALDPGVMVGYAGGEANRYSLEKAQRQRRSSVPAAPALPLRSLDRAAFTPQAAASRPKVDTRYTPSKVVTQRNVRQFVERTREVDPAAAADLEKSLRGGAFVDEIRAEFPRYGLDGSDVADATAGYLVTAWYGAQGSDQDPSKAALRSVSNQLAAAMAAVPAFAQADDATKQELAEAMMIHTIYVSAALAEAKGDTAKRGTLAKAIASGARNTFGFSMDSVTLSDRGFSLK